jgi:ferredoxin
MDSLKRLENELKNCVKCGACRAHCPVFTAVGREPVSARGKIALARAALSGQLSLDARTRDVMSQCLLCGNCVEKCANDVPTDLIILAARGPARKRNNSFSAAGRVSSPQSCPSLRGSNPCFTRWSPAVPQGPGFLGAATPFSPSFHRWAATFSPNSCQAFSGTASGDYPG